MTQDEALAKIQAAADNAAKLLKLLDAAAMVDGPHNAIANLLAATVADAERAAAVLVPAADPS